MSILIILFCIALLVILITQFKINAFLAFLIISIIAGLLLGMDASKIAGSVQKGVGDMFAGLVIIIVSGAMLGKLVADSGAAQKIASSMVKLFGEKYIHWALMITGFMIGIPLFYNVAFMLVVPLIFSVAYRYKLPPLYIGLPMIASLSVTHGFLPPHPSPTALVTQFNADIGQTLFYGILICIPTVIIAGPLFSQTLKKINPPGSKIFQRTDLPEEKLPGLGISMFTSLLPVILLGITSLLSSVFPQEEAQAYIKFVSDPAIVMLLSLAIATFTIGIFQDIKMTKVMDIYGEAIKDVAMILMIMGGAGALKQILIDTGVSKDIALLLSGLDIHPLVLGWLIAVVIRLCVGSATVAGLTAAGIIAPMLGTLGVNPNLMVLSVGAGSLFFSHVNDTGFWLFKEYFNLGIKDTIRSWSFMETIVSICGLAGVMVIHYLS
ncbi:MAG TPA: gluconate:H+ symporter [Ohtaekwangia sp.]